MFGLIEFATRSPKRWRHYFNLSKAPKAISGCDRHHSSVCDAGFRSRARNGGSWRSGPLGPRLCFKSPGLQPRRYATAAVFFTEWATQLLLLMGHDLIFNLVVG